MTAEIVQEHQEDGVFLVSYHEFTVAISCKCGWEGPEHSMGVTTKELNGDLWEHVTSQPGYLSYYRRPVSFGYDD